MPLLAPAFCMYCCVGLLMIHARDSIYYLALLSLKTLHSGTMSCADMLVLTEQLVCYYLAMGMAVNPQADAHTQGFVVIHLDKVSIHCSRYSITSSSV